VPLPSRVHEQALMPHYFYFHGFASSPRSTKAAFFAERLRERGLPLHCPDFNEPDFATLTVTRMLEQVQALVDALPPGPLVFIGSSLGAVVALQTAARTDPAGPHPIDRLVLLAPALEFGRDGLRFLGADRVARWQETGTIDVMHYAYGEPRPLDYEFYRDSQRGDTYALDVRVPTLVFQGRYDEAVDCAMVERWAAGRPHVTLRLLDDDHQLRAGLPQIWRETAAFLELAP